MNEKIEELKARISQLEERLKNPPKFPCEVYSRITGYYRSVSAWNPGKREEYFQRKKYSASELEIFEKKTGSVLGPVVSDPPKQVEPSPSPGQSVWYLFTSSRCPRCPEMKNAVLSLGIDVVEVSVDTSEGFDLAKKFWITTTPTLLCLDRDENELGRYTSSQELLKMTEFLKTA